MLVLLLSVLLYYSFETSSNMVDMSGWSGDHNSPVTVVQTNETSLRSDRGDAGDSGSQRDRDKQHAAANTEIVLKTFTVTEHSGLRDCSV